MFSELEPRQGKVEMVPNLAIQVNLATAFKCQLNLHPQRQKAMDQRLQRYC